MNVEYLIELLNNRIKTLFLAKDQAFSTGDLDRINTLDNEINGVNDTLYKLKLIQGISAAAAASGTTAADVVASGIETLISDAGTAALATQPLQRYDITSYATDPEHEQKIYTILTNMPYPLNAASSITDYIQKIAPGSPVTGAMVVGAAQVYAVDERLMLALMQNDSQFGTVGAAVATMNPGNVGNTGISTRSYASWAEGVVAVAEWLSRHHKVVLATQDNKQTVQFDTVPTSTLPVIPQVVSTTPPEPQIIPSTTLEANIPPTTTPPQTPVVPEVVTGSPEISNPVEPAVPTSTEPVAADPTSTPPAADAATTTES